MSILRSLIGRLRKRFLQVREHGAAQIRRRSPHCVLDSLVEVYQPTPPRSVSLAAYVGAVDSESAQTSSGVLCTAQLRGTRPSRRHRMPRGTCILLPMACAVQRCVSPVYPHVRSALTWNPGILVFPLGAA